jgi:hypothetical protein
MALDALGIIKKNENPTTSPPISDDCATQRISALYAFHVFAGTRQAARKHNVAFSD